MRGPHDGKASVYGYAWVDRPMLPSLVVLGAYNVTVVELDDTRGVVRVLSRITDIDRRRSTSSSAPPGQ
jgi:hypothetical protein